MDIPLDGAGGGRGSLGRMEGRAAGGEQNTKKGVGPVGVEHTGVTVVDWSIDWNVSFANCVWSILWAAVYQASRSVSASRLKNMVAI